MELTLKDKALIRTLHNLICLIEEYNESEQTHRLDFIINSSGLLNVPYTKAQLQDLIKRIEREPSPNPSKLGMDIIAGSTTVEL